MLVEAIDQAWSAAESIWSHEKGIWAVREPLERAQEVLDSIQSRLQELRRGTLYSHCTPELRANIEKVLTCLGEPLEKETIGDTKL